MQLYTAIRKGCQEHPQAFGKYFAYNSNYEIIKTCALGAALLTVLENKTGKSIKTKSDITAALYACGFKADEKEVALEQFFGIDEEQQAWIVSRNDGDHLTREQIADLLEDQAIAAME